VNGYHLKKKTNPLLVSIRRSSEEEKETQMS
jgi:hypothetical protein